MVTFTINPSNEHNQKVSI